MFPRRFFSLFISRKNKFFPEMEEVAATVLRSAETLVSFIKCNDKELMRSLYGKIKAYERTSDDLTAKIYDELNTVSSFCVPFKREDIHQLCESLDDTLDFINSSSKRVLLFQPKQIPKRMIVMCEIICEAAEAIQMAVQELKNIDINRALVLQQCEILHDIEQRGDEIYETFVQIVFETETDTCELIKNKDIMQSLERTTDIANTVGKMLKMMMVKYA